MGDGRDSHQNSMTEDSHSRPPSPENSKDDNVPTNTGPVDSVGKAPLIYRNRDGWLMPDDTIPE